MIDFYIVDNSIDKVILDDDVSLMTVHSDDWPPIPTAAMIYDYSNNSKFEWNCNGMDASANIKNIDTNKIINNYVYIPFPKLSNLTGYEDASTSLL